MLQRKFKRVEADTIEISIYLAGDLQMIREACMYHCAVYGFCVTVTECDYIYTGGHEKGVKIGIINYPRFPATLSELREKAYKLAEKVAESAFQNTVTVVDPERTTWFTRRPEDLKNV